MEEAQIALQVIINNAQDETNALARQDLIQAIGRGIGNNAAHEIAHQFLAKCCSMDAMTSADPNSAATYNNGDANGSLTLTTRTAIPRPILVMGKYNTTRIHLGEGTTLQALDQCLNGGWKKRWPKYMRQCIEFVAPDPFE